MTAEFGGGAHLTELRIRKRTTSPIAVFSSTQGGAKPLSPDMLGCEGWIFHCPHHGGTVTGCINLPAQPLTAPLFTSQQSAWMVA